MRLREKDCLASGPKLIRFQFVWFSFNFDKRANQVIVYFFSKPTKRALRCTWNIRGKHQVLSTNNALLDMFDKIPSETFAFEM